MSINDLTPEKLEKVSTRNTHSSKTRWKCRRRPTTDSPYLRTGNGLTRPIFRKDPESKKTIIKGKNSNGIEEFFSTGDMLGTVLKDVFADINIYDDDIRLLQQRFVSPIGNNAISFYKYYLMDTLMVNKRECVHLTFVPQNSQDSDLQASLVLKDSTYAVQKCTMNLPKRVASTLSTAWTSCSSTSSFPTGTGYWRMET